jgi:hypothetical protein
MDNDFQPVVGHSFSFRSTPVSNWNGVIDSAVLVVEPNKKFSYAGALWDVERRLLNVGPDEWRNTRAHGAFWPPFRSRCRL